MNLIECTLENTSKFTFASSEKTPCKIINVYDGDTIDIAKRLYPTDKIYCFRVRLAGIDTAEIHPSMNIKDRDSVIESGISAKKFLSSKVLNKILPIEITGQDKYGRLLGILYEEDENTTINQLMIDSKYAVSYDGGKKNTSI